MSHLVRADSEDDGDDKNDKEDEEDYEYDHEHCEEDERRLQKIKDTEADSKKSTV